MQEERRWGIYRLKKNGDPWKKGSSHTKTEEAAWEAAKRNEEMAVKYGQEEKYTVCPERKIAGRGEFVREDLIDEEEEARKEEELREAGADLRCRCSWSEWAVREFERWDDKELAHGNLLRNYSYMLGECPGEEVLETRLAKAVEDRDGLWDQPLGWHHRDQSRAAVQRVVDARTRLNRHRAFRDEEAFERATTSAGRID